MKKLLIIFIILCGVSCNSMIHETEKVIEENNGFTLIRTWYWSCEENHKLCAWNVNMYNGDITLENKRWYCEARAVCTL